MLMELPFIPQDTTRQGIPVLTWHHCYDESWNGHIVKESFKHPAKFGRGLVKRIILHGIERDYWQRGDLIGDPFGGVATGGLECAYHGLRWFGQELEPEFVRLGNLNIDRHRSKLKALGAPIPTLVQGDSRQFAEKVTASITSPPYADIAAGAGGLNHKPAKQVGQQSGRAKGASQDTDSRYGTAEGQISRLDGSVTSPPFADSSHVNNRPDDMTSGKARWAGGADSGARVKQDYHDPCSAGQIGKENGETYFQAMAKVYASLFASLRPGGVAAIVVKDYVRDKQRVCLCDDTLRLLEHVGFIGLERAHAMLTRSTQHADMFAGTTTETKQRKSFFRRLAEKKGSPPIDFEEAIFVQKPR